MHRIDGAGHVDHMFVSEDPATNRPPTEITPEIMNAFQEELATFIEWAGVALAKGDNTQLKQALLATFLTGSALIDHSEAADPHPVYLTSAEGDAKVADAIAGHAASADPHPEYLARSEGIQTGEVGFFALSTAPTGYLKANGAAVSRAAYAALFAAVGTTFGVGDGATTFNVPDLRGEFIRGWDDGRGADAGRIFGSGQTATKILNRADPSGGITITDQDAVTESGNPNVHIGSVDATTAASFYAVRPRNVALLACIKF